MKKSLICAALIIWGLTSFSVAEEQVELLPEVKKLIMPKPLDPELLENSYSVGLLGLLYPTDDYYEVAKQTVKTNYESLMNKEPSKKLISMKDQLPQGQVMLAWSENINLLYDELLLCSEYMAKNCFTKTIQSRDQIEQLLLDNQKLLQRYNDIVKNSDKHTDLYLLSDGSEYNDFSLDALPSYHHIPKVIRLTLNQVILQLNDHQIKQAIENIQDVEQGIRLLTPDNEIVGLIPQMLGVAYRSYLDLYLNAILDEGLLINELNNSDVVELFQPYFEQHRKNLIQTMEAEIKWVLNNLIKNGKYIMSNEALNQGYIFNQKLIELIKNDTFVDQKEQLVKECEALNAQYEDICSVFAFEDYLARYYTQSNYHNMVYLKYLILRDNIQDQDIPEFLKAQGDIAIDPITQEPFQWNAEARTIFIPFPIDKHLPIQIRMAVMKNPDIKNLQVTIPKRDSK
jgi:hypothetical protein